MDTPRPHTKKVERTGDNTHKKASGGRKTLVSRNAGVAGVYRLETTREKLIKAVGAMTHLRTRT